MTRNERLVKELARAMLNEDYRDLLDDSATMAMLRTRAQRIVDSGIIARERLDEHDVVCGECIAARRPGSMEALLLPPGEAYGYCARRQQLARAAKGE